MQPTIMTLEKRAQHSLWSETGVFAQVISLGGSRTGNAGVFLEFIWSQFAQQIPDHRCCEGASDFFELETESEKQAVERKICWID